MSTSQVTTTTQLGSQLLSRRKIVLNDIRTRMHSSDDPSKLALINHLEEVGDWAEADLQNETDIAILAHELTELREIDAALLRIKAGTYGICTVCHEPIPLARLLAQPAAQRCVACQAATEARHGVPHNASL